MDWMVHMDTAFFVTWLTAAIRLAGPVLLASLGEIYAERSGVLNIGLEGAVLIGALSSYLGAVYLDSTTVGFICGGLSGIITGCILAFLFLRAQTSQIVGGMVFNILAMGTASYIYTLLLGHAESPAIPMFSPIAIPLFSDIPVLGPILFNQPGPLYMTLILVGVAQWALFHTPFGLALRSIGENPKAASAAGLDVMKLRFIGLQLSCIGAGLAGAYLISAQVGLYRDNIVSGQGFIALAIVIFGRWSPAKALIAAFIFGAADALQLSLQLFQTSMPAQVLLALPYVLTIIAMSGILGKTNQPGALTLPFYRE